MQKELLWSLDPNVQTVHDAFESTGIFLVLIPYLLSPSRDERDISSVSFLPLRTGFFDLRLTRRHSEPNAQETLSGVAPL
jgi:hypothetical protein